MSDEKIYPVWKRYTPRPTPEGLQFEAGDYRLIDGQWFRKELGTCQEFINGVHTERQRRSVPPNRMMVQFWLNRPLDLFIEDEDTDG